MEIVQIKRDIEEGKRDVEEKTRELLEERLQYKIHHPSNSDTLTAANIMAELTMQVFDLKVEVRRVADALEKIDGEGVKTFVS